MASSSDEDGLPTILTQMPPFQVCSKYLNQVASSTSGNQVIVRDAGCGKGKGIFSVRDFKEGDVIFRERPLVAMQHTSSSRGTTVCSHNHVFVGSVEGLIAKSLVHVIDSAAAQAADTFADNEGVEDEEADELQHRLALVNQHVSMQDIEHLQSGKLKLPLSETIELPHPVPCRNACGAVYSSKAAEETAWQQQHCLLCPGCPATSSAGQPPTANTPCSQHPVNHNGCGPSSAAAGSGSRGQEQAAAGSSSSQETQSLNGCSGTIVDIVSGLEVHRAYLGAFFEHAARTNDVFVLVAKAVSMTALHAMHILQQQQQPSQPDQEHKRQKQQRGLPHDQEATINDGGGISRSKAAESIEADEYVQWAWQQVRIGQDCPGPSSSSSCTPSSHPGAAGAALLKAWLPLSVGWKRLWWETVAVPEDVDDEQAFRQQLKDLACDSLELLTPAWPGVASLFPALLSLEVWGGLVGMFELNNLAMAVPSPVEDYFLLIDALPEPERTSCQQFSQRWLDALDKWYDTPAQGTGFMALQSCANHSCEPNAATEGEGSGFTAVYATRSIKAGEEITITYIEEDGESTGKAMSYKQRQDALRDYGFKCQCTLCLRDEAKVAKKPARSGVKMGRR